MEGYEVPQFQQRQLQMKKREWFRILKMVDNNTINVIYTYRSYKKPALKIIP